MHWVPAVILWVVIQLQAVPSYTPAATHAHTKRTSQHGTRGQEVCSQRRHRRQLSTTGQLNAAASQAVKRRPQARSQVADGPDLRAKAYDAEPPHPSCRLSAAPPQLQRNRRELVQQL
jgi:hypothetical protein